MGYGSPMFTKASSKVTTQGLVNFLVTFVVALFLLFGTEIDPVVVSLAITPLVGSLVGFGAGYWKRENRPAPSSFGR
jgi:hypothetical protein